MFTTYRLVFQGKLRIVSGQIGIVPFQPWRCQSKGRETRIKPDTESLMSYYHFSSYGSHEQKFTKVLSYLCCTCSSLTVLLGWQAVGCWILGVILWLTPPLRMLGIVMNANAEGRNKVKAMDKARKHMSSFMPATPQVWCPSLCNIHSMCA